MLFLSLGFYFSLRNKTEPACLIFFLRLRGGDVELNPGLEIYVCPVFRTVISRRVCAVLCYGCHEWLHLKCSGLRSSKSHTENFRCLPCSTTVSDQTETFILTPPLQLRSSEASSITPRTDLNSDSSTSDTLSTPTNEASSIAPRTDLNSDTSTSATVRSRSR